MTVRGHENHRRRIAFVVPDDRTAFSYYRHLIEALTAAGARVTVFSAPGPYVGRIRDLHAEHVAVPYARFLSPLQDVLLFRALLTEFVRRRFDVVQNFTVKANLYGGAAALVSGTPAVINTVEGAGILYSTPLPIVLRVVRPFVEFGLRRLRSRVSWYWFVNRHDRDTFVSRGLATADRSVVGITTGVDVREFDPDTVSADEVEALHQEIGIDATRPVVTMVAGRLLRSKGVEAFIALAQELRASRVAHFVLVGPEELENPDALSPAVVRRAVEDGVLHWIGFRTDIATIYAASAIAVVPTLHAEGTAKSVTESMAMACAVVCTDSPAIRELVQPDVDAVIVGAGDIRSLVDTVRDLIANAERRRQLGHRARRAVVQRFNAKTEAEAAVREVYSRLPGWGTPSRLSRE